MQPGCPSWRRIDRAFRELLLSASWRNPAEQKAVQRALHQDNRHQGHGEEGDQVWKPELGHRAKPESREGGEKGHFPRALKDIDSKRHIPQYEGRPSREDTC